MRRISKIFLLSLVFAFTFLGCHKYQDDAFISFKEPKQAIVGWYKITNYYINGIDSISSPLYSDLSVKPLMEFKEGPKNYGTPYQVYVASWANTGYFQQSGYEASFVNNSKSIDIVAVNNIQHGIYVFVSKKSTWDILKMSDTELWLMAKMNGNTYEIHFAK